MKMESNSVLLGDCLDILDQIPEESIDLIYLDPPFFTQKIQRLSDRQGAVTFSFSDIWAGREEYASYMFERIAKLKSKLKPTGSIFFHCDKSASHLVRLLLDYVFGEENFRSEVIWHFRRWSNSQNGLLPNHQNIFWYSRSSEYKFNKIFGEYSSSTNVDQLMQRRVRDHRGKTIYERDESGSVISNGVKQGVPMSDVWEIPYLNPKAKERTGYPTQKPILLLERIIEITTSPGDVVLDPFCGSGTTLVAAKLLDRKFIGIDISEEAIALANGRLDQPIKTESKLLEAGRKSYESHDQFAAQTLGDVEYVPIQRNKGIDGVLKAASSSVPVFVRVQRNDESIIDAIAALRKAAKNKGGCKLVVICTNAGMFKIERFVDGVALIPSLNESVSKLISEMDGAWATVI